MMTNIRTVVIGAGGYSGAELVALISAHPHADLVGLFGSPARATEGPSTFGDVHPRWRQWRHLTIEAMDFDAVAALEPDAVLLATPPAVSHTLASAMVELGAVVLDLSGAFRLGVVDAYPGTYGFTHLHPQLLAEAVYGLPELNREALRTATLVAVPGCYPTSAVLPLAPLAAAGAIEAGRDVIVDATSGVSGAGRSASLRTHVCEVSLQPYNVLGHRHAPEIARHAAVPVVFTPHLGPFDRGILATIHVPLASGWDEDRVRETLGDRYAGEPFIRLLDPGDWPSTGAVRGTNFCDIALAADDGRRHAVVVTAIDNLIKGAAGQAVQCLNVRFALPETEALLQEMACLAC